MSLCLSAGPDTRTSPPPSDFEAVAARRRQREEERDQALALARRSLRARVRPTRPCARTSCAAAPQRSRGRVPACRAQGLEPVEESGTEMELRLRWAEEARAEAEKRRAVREAALADARARGEGARLLVAPGPALALTAPSVSEHALRSPGDLDWRRRAGPGAAGAHGRPRAAHPVPRHLWPGDGQQQLRLAAQKAGGAPRGRRRCAARGAASRARRLSRHLDARRGRPLLQAPLLGAARRRRAAWRRLGRGAPAAEPRAPGRMPAGGQGLPEQPHCRQGAAPAGDGRLLRAAAGALGSQAVRTAHSPLSFAAL